MAEGRRGRGGARFLGLGALALSASACIDSRWNEPQRLQQAAAQHATPSALRATPETEIGRAGATKMIRTLKIRAFATPRYAAEVVDWPRQFADLIDDANAVLVPTLNLRLAVSGTELWASPGDDDLSARLDDLRALDPGPEVEWVVGLVGSVPRLEESFHQLGMARVGRHLVMRAMNDASEFEDIERNLSRLDAEERRRLYKRRKRHKSAAVFLHELGHTLWLIHETEARTLMHPRYDPKEEGYSPPSARMMRASLDHRLDPAAQAEPAFRDALRVELQTEDARWVASERDALIEQLSARAAPTPAPTSASAPTRRGARESTPAPVRKPAEAAAITALSPTDVALFRRTEATDEQGDPQRAFTDAKPLFAAYPAVYAVQELRCHLVTEIGGVWDEVQAECAPLMKMTKALSRPKR